MVAHFKLAGHFFTASQWPVWIVSDVRRKTDVEWFQNNYSGKVKTIRIEASEDTRKKRLWSFVSGTIVQSLN